MLRRMPAFLLGATFAFGCARAPEMEDGAISSPQRIVVLGPSTAANLFAMEQGHRVVGVSDYNTLAEAAELPRVGGLADPSLERIVALAPDLVLVQGDIPRVEEVCRTSGIRFHAFTTDTLKEWRAEIDWLGKTLGAEEQAQGVRDDFEDTLEELRLLGFSVAPKVLLVIFRRADEASGMMVAGDQGFLHELLLAVGGTNVLEGSGQDYFDLNEERLVRLAPDIILEFNTADGADQRARLDAEALAIWRRDFPSLPAVQQGKVHTLTGKDLLIPGPGMLDTAGQIRARLKGE